MVVIEVGKEWDLGKHAWEGFIDGYFESKRHAEKYLINQDYEMDTDEIFFKQSSEEVTDIARVIQLQKIEVEI